jgi:hypothetical protein
MIKKPSTGLPRVGEGGMKWANMWISCIYTVECKQTQNSFHHFYTPYSSSINIHTLYYCTVQYLWIMYIEQKLVQSSGDAAAWTEP